MLAYPKSLLPKVLPRAPGGHLETPFSLVCVLGSDYWRYPSGWAAQGDIRVPLGMLLEYHVVLPQCQRFPVSPSPWFPQQNHAAYGTEDRRYEFRPKVLWSICGVGKAPATI